MAHNELMNKVRHWDNMVAKWLMRHFYFMFFQMALLIIFLFWFVNMFNVIDTTQQISKINTLERILATQSVNMTIAVFLLILNSFWILYVFNTLQRMIVILKDINFSLLRSRNRDRR